MWVYSRSWRDNIINDFRGCVPFRAIFFQVVQVDPIHLVAVHGPERVFLSARVWERFTCSVQWGGLCYANVWAICRRAASANLQAVDCDTPRRRAMSLTV